MFNLFQIVLGGEVNGIYRKIVYKKVTFQWMETNPSNISKHQYTDICFIA